MCDCPFCPLVRLNIQVCDVEVKVIEKRNSNNVQCIGRIPKNVMEGRDEAEKQIIRDCFNHIALWGLDEMRKNKEIAAGYEKNDCVLNLQRRGKCITICFHAKPRAAEEPVVAEDPE